MKNDLKYKEKIQEKIKIYIKMLLDDFKSNHQYTDLANKLFFNKEGAIIEWIRAIDAKSFESFKSSSELSTTVKNSWDENDIQNIEFDSALLQKSPEYPYAFFTKKEFSTIEDVEKGFPGFYYVFDEDFFEKIDLAVMSRLNDYNEINKGNGIYKKTISDSASINICRRFHYTEHSGVEEYQFPKVSVELDREEYCLFGKTDVRDFLFLPATGFTFFYMESHSISYAFDRRITGVVRKRDQPVVYCGEGEKNFVVSNTLEKLTYYNKYILLIIELHNHYFRVFEKWLIEQIIHS